MIFFFVPRVLLSFVGIGRITNNDKPLYRRKTKGNEFGLRGAQRREMNGKLFCSMNVFCGLNNNGYKLCQ